MLHGRAVPIFQGAIFDLDGTVADNMPWHARAWIELSLREGGVPVDEAWVYARAGMKNDDLIPELVGRALTAQELERLSARKEELYRALYRAHLTPLRGLSAFLDVLQARGVKLAVASAAPRQNRDFLLDGLGLRGRFSAEVGPEHAARGKPAPDMFLAAAAALAVEPALCLVVEDAVNGVKAAVAAGSPCLAVTTTATEQALRAAGARWVTPDFSALPADLFA